MSDVVRVSANGRWAYLPVGSQAHQHLLRFAENGLADSEPTEVRLHSEAGPLFWEIMEEKGEERIPPFLSLAAMTDRGICLLSGEQLEFGKADNGSYNEYADMSWFKNPSVKPGIPLSSHSIEDGDIVMTAWPHTKRIIPARAYGVRREIVLELIEPPSPGDRCFVVDDSAGLVTASLASNGTSELRVMPQNALNSWLFSVGTNASRQKSSRFKVEDMGDYFVIKDRRKNRRFGARYGTSDPKAELESIEIMLSHGGIGSIIPRYDLVAT